MATRLVSRFARSNGCTSCVRSFCTVGSSPPVSPSPRSTIPLVQDGKVDWNAISQFLKEHTTVSSVEDAPPSLREALGLVTESVSSSSDPRQTLPLALGVAAACGAPAETVKQLYGVVDRSRTNFAPEDVIRLLGPLSKLSKACAAPSHAVVTPLYDCLVKNGGLRQRQDLLTSNDGAHLRHLCQGLVTMRTFHPKILDDLVIFLENLVTGGGEDHLLTRFDLVSDCLYAISYLRKAAPQLFKAVLSEIDDLTYIDYYSLESASKLNWAFLAQHVERPKSTMKVFMRRMFEHMKKKEMSLDYVSELSQVVDSLKDIVSFEEVIKLTSETHITMSPAAKLLEHLGPLGDSKLVVLNVASQNGFMPVASLVSRKTGELDYFPLGRVPSQMTAQLPQSLGVFAVSLLLLPDRHFLEPLNEVSGVVKRQMRMMTKFGWHIKVVRVADIQHLRSPELDDFVERALKEAVVDDRGR